MFRFVAMLERTSATTYVDERGVPGQPGDFVVAGVILWGDLGATEASWRRWLNANRLVGKKTRKYSRNQLAEAARLVSGLQVLPVATHSVLTPEHASLVKRKEREYRDSNHPAKVAQKISAASWVWKAQMNKFLAMSTVAAHVRLGRIGSVSFHLDQFTDQADVARRYRELLEDRLSGDGRHERLLANAGRLRPLARFVSYLLGSADWSLNMNAKGHLSELADLTCTCYGRYLTQEDVTPWKTWRDLACHARPALRRVVETDATSEVLDFVAKIRGSP